MIRSPLGAIRVKIKSETHVWVISTVTFRSVMTTSSSTVMEEITTPLEDPEASTKVSGKLEAVNSLQSITAVLNCEGSEKALSHTN